MTVFEMATLALGTYCAGMATAWLLQRELAKAYKATRTTALDGWQSARDGWANALRQLSEETNEKIFAEMADHLDAFPVNRPLPPYREWEPNPGLKAGPKHHVEGSPDEVAQKIAKGIWQ